MVENLNTTEISQTLKVNFKYSHILVIYWGTDITKKRNFFK